MANIIVRTDNPTMTIRGEWKQSQARPPRWAMTSQTVVKARSIPFWWHNFIDLFTLQEEVVVVDR